MVAKATEPFKENLLVNLRRLSSQLKIKNLKYESQKTVGKLNREQG